MPNRKTLLIAWYMDIHWRNVHGSGLLAHLEKDFDRVIVLGPKLIAKEPGMKFESIADRWLGSDPILDWTAEIHKLKTILENTHYPEHVERTFKSLRPRDYFFVRWLYPFVRILFFAVLFLRLLLALPKLLRLRPSVVLSNSFVWGSFDSVLGLYAKLAGSPWIALITGWDNPSTKGRFPLIPSRVIVWGEKNREDCGRYQGIVGENVVALPPPQLARLRQVALEDSDQERLITYVGVTKTNYQYEEEFVDLLIETWRSSGLRDRFRLCLRPHPNDGQSWAHRYQGDPRLYVDPAALSRSSQWTVFSSDQEGLDSYFRLLRKSAVVITHYSTAMVESGLLKVPTIVPRMAFPKGTTFETRLDYFPHTMELRKSPGLIAVTSAEELHEQLLATTGGLPTETMEKHYLACQRITKFPSESLFADYSKALSSQL